MPSLGDVDIPNILMQNALLEFGFSTDEIYYFNPTVHFGFTFLYGTASYNIGKYPNFRYGLGTGAKINEQFSLRLSFNTGKFLYNESNYSYPDTVIVPSPDTLFPPEIIIENHNIPISIQSKLSRINLTLVWNRNEKFSVSGGATFNYLKTDYFSNDLPFLPDSLPTPILEGDSRLRTITPPYVFSTTYNNDNTGNAKVWVGLHITFLYHLPIFRHHKF